MRVRCRALIPRAWGCCVFGLVELFGFGSRIAGPMAILQRATTFELKVRTLEIYVGLK